MVMTDAERMRRYRARKRGEDVPKVKSGPKAKEASPSEVREICEKVADEGVEQLTKTLVPYEAAAHIDDTSRIILELPKPEWLDFSALSIRFRVTRAWLNQRMNKIRWRGPPAVAEFYVVDVEKELQKK